MSEPDSGVQNMMGQPNMQRYWLPWLAGMPAETTRAIYSMIFGGIFELLPQLRVTSHIAAVSFDDPRTDQARISCRPDLVAVDNRVSPEQYLGRFWVHDIDLLSHIIKAVSSVKVTLGSDYPFPLGGPELGKFIEETDLEEKIKEDTFIWRRSRGLA